MIPVVAEMNVAVSTSLTDAFVASSSAVEMLSENDPLAASMNCASSVSFTVKKSTCASSLVATLSVFGFFVGWPNSNTAFPSGPSNSTLFRFAIVPAG